ncbi:MAG: FHA domain-containing protein [Planctomycetota bacterium]
MDLLVLMLLKSKGKGVRFEVSGRVPVFIGRHALGLDAIDSKMSRQHAEIWFERGVWLLRDLNSTNGTFVNGKRASGLVELEIGDRIRCGRTDLVVADLAPIDRHEDGTWGSDPDDTAMAAGELSGLLDAAQRDGVTPGVVRLGDAKSDTPELNEEPVEEPTQDPADPDADLISLLDEDHKPTQRRPEPKPEPEVEAKTEPEEVAEQAEEQTPRFDEALGATELPALTEELETPGEPAELAHDSHADEYTGDAVIDLPPVTPAAPVPPAAHIEPKLELDPASSVEPQDSPPEAATPDKSDAAEAASVPPEAPVIPDIAEIAEAASDEPVAQTPTPADELAASADSDGSEPNEAPRADEPVASDSPSPDPSDQDDDEMLQLGFRGSEEPSRKIEIDDPGLRGETPGRFTVEDVDETLDTPEAEAAEALETIEAIDDADDLAEPEPKAAESPWAKGERAALLGPPVDHDFDQGRPASGARYPGHAGGRGRQKLPMAVVGTLVVVFAGSAWVLAALQQGWISPPSVTGNATPEASTETPATDATTDLLGTDQLADARRPRSNSPTRIYADRRARTAEQIDPANATPQTAPTSVTPSVATEIATQASEFDAFDNAISLPTPAPIDTPAEDATPDTVLASATAPRVGSAEQLQAIIDRADAERSPAPETAAATAEPERPQAVENPSESFVWSGITIGNDDTVFKADTEPSKAQATTNAAETENTSIDLPAAAPQPTVVATATPDFGGTAQPTKPDAVIDPAILNAPRRVAFLVDISGTMVDSMPQLRAHLANAIDRLEPDTAFTVLLFRKGETIELPPTGLRLASASARSQAIRWLGDDLADGAGSVQLGGRSDPTRALNTALSYDASDLVLLSDNALGKRAKANGGDLGLLDLMDALEDYAGVKLHAVQFNYADERQLLRQLTDRFDGNYEFVEEVLDASPDGLEPLTLIDALR